jgi:Mrp family chromosome partitioning ATPase
METKMPEVPEFEVLSSHQHAEAGKPQSAAARQPNAARSLLEWVVARPPKIHRNLRGQRPFFRFLRRAGSNPALMEQFARLRDAILLSGMQEKETTKGLTIALAGVQGGEGTSLISLQLVLALGQCTQKKVAFLDGGFGTDRFSALFNVLDLCRNSITLQTGFSEIAGFYNQRYPNVYFLHSALCQESMQFFSDKRLAAFLAELRQHFDFTILDLPPLLKGTTGLFTLPHVDRLVLVVEAGRTKLAAIERCIEVARQAGREICGVVMNRQRTPWWSRLIWRGFFY